MTQFISQSNKSHIAAIMPKILECSEFVARILSREPTLLDTLQPDLSRSYVTAELASKLANVLSFVQDEPQLHSVLRRFRNQEMARIIWRDIAGWATLEETLEDLSALADACVQQVTEILYTWQTRDIGYPEGATLQQQHLIVLAMGKLGARELNMSSDIDLIFVFPSHGQVRRANGSISQLDSQQFFQRLAQRLIHVLQQPSAEGFVFRVDIRLRPFGDAGALVFSINAMEDYYQTQAREWERYAMVKARALTGDKEAVTQLMQIIRAFVYRRYLDFVAIEALRDMKRLIASEVMRKGCEHDIKLGPGGIREIEFIGQVFQIIRGGRELELQIPSILEVLKLLGAKGLLPNLVIEELIVAYKFLRQVENRLQAWRDQQTHVLPIDANDRLRLAHSMNYANWEQFVIELNLHRQRVQQHFENVFAVSQEELPNNVYKELWLGNIETNQATAMLATAGFVKPLDILQRLQIFKDTSACRTIGKRGQILLEQLMPKILELTASYPNPQMLLERLLRLVEKIVKRTTYLALLVERPVVLTQLAKLTAESAWIAEQLTRYPLLLDELLDSRRLYAPQRHQELMAERNSFLTTVDIEDQEMQIERLCQFVHSNRLRIAAADLTGVIPLMVVSDYLTDLAEVALDTSLQQCWKYLTKRYEMPTGLDHQVTGFAIIGYGKLGGIELGYGSDLDLVFLHDSTLTQDMFYNKLSHRLIHMLNTRTPVGIAYEIDTRLRPNGNAGVLVSSINAFEHYQTHNAWTWEHQALLRARPVAGDPSVRTKFRAIRLQALTKPREVEQLRIDVVQMREKMREQLDSSNAEFFDLKQGLGGITDIEFMVQYLVLKSAASFPDLLDWTDTIRWLETLARYQLLPSTQTNALANCYRTLRGFAHRLTLKNELHRIPNTQLTAERYQVQTIWQTLFG
jgi:glutamate-ammonia-ligase adenylyltransferase